MIITEDSTTEFSAIAGKKYVFSASGDFGGGSISLQWSDGTEWVTFADCIFSSDNEQAVIVPTSMIRFLVDGTTAPNISANIFPSSDTGPFSPASVGLGNVDNTSDANKPVSTAQQTALDLKASLAGATFSGAVNVPSNLFYGVTFDSGYTAGSELILTSSPDGVNFNIVGGPGIYSDTNGYTVRDPRILYKNGRYYVAYTVNAFAGTSYKFVRIAVSDNLLNWSKHVDVDFSGYANSDRVWGPKFLVESDGTVRMYAAAGSGTSPTNFQMVMVVATASDLTTWTTPTVMTGTSFPTNMFDGSLLKVGSTYHMVFRNLVSGHIEHTSSTSPVTGFSAPTNTGLDTVGGTLEGCEITEMGNGTYRLYIDEYPSKGMYYSDTTDFSAWTAKTLIRSPIIFSNMGVVRGNDVKTSLDFIKAEIALNLAMFTYGGSQTIGLGKFTQTNRPITSSDYHIRHTRGDGTGNMIITVDPRNDTGGSQATILIWDSANLGNYTYFSRAIGGGKDVFRFGNSTNNVDFFGHISTLTAGYTLKVASGSNAKAGTFTLVAGTATVANTSVTANSVIICTLKTLGGTRTGNPDIVPTASTGFVATGGGSDTSTYNYVILEVN